MALSLTKVDFTVLEGIRTIERQEELYAIGASWTMKSFHLTGHAVDLGAWVEGEIRWDWPLYHKIAAAVKEASQELNIAYKWGGDWKKTPDGPHFQLKRRLPFPSEQRNERNRRILERVR